MRTFRHPLLRSLAHSLQPLLDDELRLTLNVAILRAAEIPRAEILAKTGCTDLDFRVAVARLDRCAEEYADLKTLMEEEPGA